MMAHVRNEVKNDLSVPNLDSNSLPIDEKLTLLAHGQCATLMHMHDK